MADRVRQAGCSLKLSTTAQHSTARCFIHYLIRKSKSISVNLLLVGRIAGVEPLVIESNHKNLPLAGSPPERCSFQVVSAATVPSSAVLVTVVLHIKEHHAGWRRGGNVRLLPRLNYLQLRCDQE